MSQAAIHMTLRCEVLGPAATQGSKRIVQRPGARAVMIEDCGRSRSWRQEMVLEMIAAREKLPSPIKDVACIVEITVIVKRPKAHFGTGKNAGLLKANAPRHPGSGLDVDKLARCVLDAGTIAKLWSDDQRVYDLRVRRQFEDFMLVQPHLDEGVYVGALLTPADEKWKP